jgi:hypothetical protein
MEANGSIRSLAAPRLRTLLRQSIDALHASFLQATPRHRLATQLHKHDTDSSFDQTETEYRSKTLAVLKQDHYATLRESEDYLDRVPALQSGLCDITRCMRACDANTLDAETVAAGHSEMGADGLGVHLQQLSKLYAQETAALQLALSTCIKPSFAGVLKSINTDCTFWTRRGSA